MNEQLQVIISKLESRSTLQALSPKHIWNPELDVEIGTLDLAKQAMNARIIALMAGLHLWNDSLHTSHEFSQQIEDNETGSYWHGIMHRMEQDYSNSKYWFRRAGNHPVKQELKIKVADMLKQQTHVDNLPSSTILESLQQFRDHQSWNSDEFVEVVKLQENGNGSEETRHLLELIQQIELKALFYSTQEALLKAQ